MTSLGDASLVKAWRDRAGRHTAGEAALGWLGLEGMTRQAGRAQGMGPHRTHGSASQDALR
jgi:hypothetical protein